MSANGNKATNWWIFGTVAVIGLVIAAVAIGSTSGSPRDFIDDKYRCSPDPEDHDSAVCTSSSSPSTVASEIRRAVRPIDTHSDYQSGATFFQYRDDILAIFPDGSGSRIEIDDYNRGYTRHSTYIGTYWSSTRPGSSSGSGGYGGFGGGK
ncbi:DUF4247 domain-containing protein [Stackebrandtia soli]|uniref:DUF4247 domain-containing protein n=1 Tax=Stackebrandtia soli TaxID=1892856 RepID=UPI0039EBE560